MTLSWMEKLLHFFTPSPPFVPEGIDSPAAVGSVETKPPVKEKTEFEKVLEKFDFRSDMIVISYDRASKLSQGERDWLDSLGKKVHYFDDDILVNIAIVRTM